MKTTIAGRLEELRAEHGISISELAAMTGVSRPYLSEIESGKNTNIGLPILIELADYFGVTLDYLVGREEPS